MNTIFQLRARGAVAIAILLAGCARSGDSSSASSNGGVAPHTRLVPGETCAATATSLTPAAWRPVKASDAPGDTASSTRALAVVADVPLHGPANRFDYQSIDTATRRLYISHMNAGTLVVFDLARDSVVAEVSGLPRVTGVWAVPEHGEIYASAAGAHEVAVIDARTLAITARIGDIRFPDGIAFVAGADKVFVSDERGGAAVVIDARTHAKRSTIALGGEAGNTHYDAVSGCVLVAVQTRGDIVAIDPASERIVARYPVAGVVGPHGFTLDDQRRLAFVTGEGNASLAVVDLRTMRITQRLAVGADPDVLAWDAAWRRLYVASEGGVLSTFREAGDSLVPSGELRIPHAHSVAVDPSSHRVYLPLENVNGRPVLRILALTP